MKKLLTLAVVALFAMSASAEKGGMYLGLTGIGSPVGTGVMIYDNKTDFGAAPEFGYFISDQLALGIVAGFYGSSIKDNEGDNPFTFRVNPYARYFLIQDGNFGLFLQGNVAFESTNAPAKVSVFGVSINPGVSYNLSDKFTATAAFGWLGFESTSPDGGDSTSEFGLRVNGSTLKVGLAFNF